MANIHRLIFLLFLSFFSFNSSAALNKVYLYYSGTMNFGYVSSYEELCSLGHAFYSSDSSKPSNWVSLTFHTTICNETRYQGYRTGFLSNGTPVGGDNSSNRYGFPIAKSLMCPLNSSSSGSQCICNEGYEEKDGNSCVLPEPPDPCKGLDQYCETLRNKSDQWVVNNKKSPSLLCSKPSVFVPVIGGDSSYWDDRFPGCSRGCLMLPSGFDVSYKDNNDKWITSGNGLHQGSSCSPEDIQDTEDPENPEPQEPELATKPDPNCRIGDSLESYNGTKVCLPPKSSSGVTSTEKTNNGDGTTTESKTSVTCENGKCTINTEKITKNNETNNIVNNVTSTTTVGQPEYCAKNPTAGVCQEKKPSDKEPQIPGTDTGSGSGNGEGEGKGSEFGGSCSSGFTCEGGDGIACAIAKKQHEDSCALNEATEESALYQQSKGKDGNVTGDLEGNSTHQFTQIKSNPRFSASSCVQDLNITVWGTSVEIPISKVCPWLSNLGYVLVAVAWIMAAAIVMRGR